MVVRRRTLLFPKRVGVATAALALLLFFLPPPVAAQSFGTIEGRVTDAGSNQPLLGAQISIPGTQRGVVANAQGRYSIAGLTPGEVTVRFQIIGYETVTRTVNVVAGQTTTLDVALSTRALALDELVVTGVGQATSRRELATSVAVLGEQAIAEAPVQSLDQLLQGRVAGSTVSMVSAQPGTGSVMSFRGTSSVFGSQTPVIYVDGVRMDNAQSTTAGTGGEQSSALSELLTSDIERIEVTRGGAASTLFGSDAATGVIQIFTKRGQSGAPRFQVRIEQGADVPELKYILDSQLIYENEVADGELPENYLRDEFFQTGWVQNYSLNVSGGSDAVTYHVSARVQDSEGVQPKNASNLFVTRGSMQAAISENSRITFSGSYTRSSYGRIYNGTAIADPLTALEVGDAQFFTGAPSVREAKEILLMPDIDEDVDRVNFATGYTYDSGGLLGFRLNGGVDRRSNEQTQFHPIGFTAGESTGLLRRQSRDFTSVTFEAATTLSFDLMESARNTLTLGAQGFRDNAYVIFGQGVTFGLPGSKDFGEAATVTSGESRSQVFSGGLYADERLALWERLFLNVGVRVDAGTSFGDDVDFATYPKASAAYDVMREDVLRDLVRPEIVSDFRLRAAYGETGKFPPPFLRDRSFDATPFRGESAPRFDNPGNLDLRPEVTKTFEAGFEAAFASDRLGVDFTWYDATTEDALFFVPEQPASGQGTQVRNVGAISNRGIEVDLSLLVMNRPGFSWQLGATYQQVDNEVTDMGGAADFFVEPQKRVTEGETVGAWYVNTPIDTNNDGNLDGFEQRFTGKGPTPTKSGSFSTRFTLFNDLTLTALADWAGGHQVMDYGSAWATYNGIIRRELVEPGYTYPIRHNLAGVPGSRYPENSARSEFIYDADWWKLREISARYRIPIDLATQVGATGGTAFFSVRNVFISSDNPLVDPELAGLVGGGLALGGESSVTLSPPRSFRFGVEFTF